jgi:hypothetical protein
MFALSLQLVAIFGCCLGVGLTLFPFVPKSLSALSKLLLSFVGGLFLTVLIPQNLIYLGVPVRISAWFLVGLAAVQLYLGRHEWGCWIRTLRTNADIQILGVVVMLALTFHSVVPIQQGIDSYYGKAHPDQLNYVFLAEFLKEKPYSTDLRDVGHQPWLMMPVRFKDERIGQSVITAEISVLSQTNAKSSYAATVIFFLLSLAFCLYVLLRFIGIDRVCAALGAFLPTILPAITRLSLDGFLSQTAVLFVFVFFANLLHQRDLNARSFTLFFSLGLAYLIAAYSELAPFGCCSFLLGVFLTRPETFRQKRLMVWCAILLVALLNPFYIRNLITFLSGQYFTAAIGRFMDDLVPHVLTVSGWSEILFGVVDQPWQLFSELAGVLFAAMAIIGFLLLQRSEKLAFGSILLPVLGVVFFLATRVPLPAYPIAKLIFSFSAFACVLAFSAISKFALPKAHQLSKLLRTSLLILLVATAAWGSIKEYYGVVNETDFLESLRDPSFLDVCRGLENLRDKTVLICDNDPYRVAWFCYHARKNSVYCSATQIGNVSVIGQSLPFLDIPRTENIDFVVTRDRIVDTKSAGSSGN